MTVETTKAPSSWKGLSTDTKPTTGGAGSTFHESDTDTVYEWDGDSWAVKTFGGSSLVRIASTALTDAQDREWGDVVPLAASGGGAELTTPVMVAFKKIAFTITGLATETITVKAWLDGIKSVETAALLPIDRATGAVAASVNLSNGDYLLDPSVAHFLHFEKSASTDTPTITYLGVV